ncbi:cadherin-like beta sandwich domain-containing protein [Cohnella hashimotonis]|uniref:Cadherin-like beta sandwich domain-containing protein n=1 Tax=Cohnella hashimotonis TaxID=2826895 RepID=A0ABT6TUN6_9BACL|nr:cadherin-like beta sandwich domain-containing protein [Cohnella hashimotonis]MDI4650266.1 cadherin-like beta sandwich domain-containing protein [Cohnella hashimotonis]
MIRKFGFTLLAALLLLLPVSAAFGGEAHAASSSRIAVIKQLSGDVQVQKAGGSKLFKAFAKLSLNQGDKLITGSKGSAVLQFSNGTSEDDKFTVGENATLTFSKLSDKKGTVTKVSMLKGTAWVDVKSIKSQDDDFKLETPTAIMGVRGTAFLVRVNPETGGTNTSVMSGIVRFTSENAEKTGSESGESPGKTGTSGGSKTIDLYPTQQLSLDSTSGTDLGELTTLVDIEEIVKNASPALIEAILRSKEKIDEENRQTVEKFKQSGVPAGLQQQLEQFIQNTQELLGVIAKQAIDQKKMDEQQIKKIEEQEKTSFGLDKDQLSQLSDKEKSKQEKAKQLAEEAAKKKAAEEAAKLKELEQRLAGQMQTIEASKLAQAEANRKSAAEAAAKAEAALLAAMTPVQQQQYSKDKAGNYGTSLPTPTPPRETGPTPTPGSDNARLNGLGLPTGISLSPTFNPDILAYTVSVGGAVSFLDVTPSLNEPGAKLTVNGMDWTGGAAHIPLAYGDNEIQLHVTAANGTSSRIYKIKATRQLLDSADIEIAGGLPLHIDFTAANPATTFDVPANTASLTLKLPVAQAPSVTVNGQSVPPTGAGLASLVYVAADSAWTYSIPLQPGSNTIVIQAQIGNATKTYQLIANRAATLTAESFSIETNANTPVNGILRSHGSRGAVSYEIVAASEHGEATLNAADSSSFSYTPDDDFSGMDSFQFKAMSNGEESAPATVFIWVKPLDIELKGLVSLGIAWGEAPIEPMLLYSFKDGSYVSKSYGLFVPEEEDRQLSMQFQFDPAVVSDARLTVSEETIQQEEDGSLFGSMPMDDPVVSVRLSYSVTEGGTTTDYEVYYIAVKQQQWAANLMTDGRAAVHLVPAGGGNYTVSVRGKDQNLMLRSNSFDMLVESDVWVYEADPLNPGGAGNRVKAVRNAEGYYIVPLSPGWNVAEIRTYYPGHEGTAKEGVVHIWRGDGLPDGYDMASIIGTPVQYPAEASAAPVEFIRDASQQTVYRAAMPVDSVAVNVKPIPGSGMKIDAVYQGGYTSFDRVSQTPEGSGRYPLQLYGDWANYGFVVVRPISGDGPPLAYTLAFEPDMTTDVQASIAYKQDGEQREAELDSFAGSLHAMLNDAPGQSDFKLYVNGADPDSSVRINDVEVPYDETESSFTYPFAPADGDNAFLIEMTDSYGRHASIDLHLYYGSLALNPVGLASWSAQSSHGEEPATESSLVYEGQKRFRLIVPEAHDLLDLRWVTDEGTTEAVVLGPYGAGGTGRYVGALPMGRSEYTVIVRDEQGSRLDYDLVVYRGAPVYPRLIYTGWGSSMVFAYNEATGRYEANLDDFPERMWIGLGMPAGGEAVVKVGDVPYAPNSDGLYTLTPEPGTSEIVMQATGLFEGAAWSCNLVIKRASE